MSSSSICQCNFRSSHGELYVSMTLGLHIRVKPSEHHQQWQMTVLNEAVDVIYKVDGKWCHFVFSWVSDKIDLHWCTFLPPLWCCYCKNVNWFQTEHSCGFFQLFWTVWVSSWLIKKEVYALTWTLKQSQHCDVPKKRCVEETCHQYHKSATHWV